MLGALVRRQHLDVLDEAVAGVGQVATEFQISTGNQTEPGFEKLVPQLDEIDQQRTESFQHEHVAGLHGADVFADDDDTCIVRENV